MTNDHCRSSGVILTICIPTYNRAAALKQCIESLMSSMDGHWAHCELIVLDNASTDNTNEIVRLICENGAPVQYVRNDENIGGDRNIAKSLTIGTGEYVWCMGDDDLAEHGFISEVLRCIREGADAVIVNFSTWNSDMTHQIKRRQFSSMTDAIYEKPAAVLSDFGINVSFISCIVARRSCLSSLPYEQRAPFIETGLSQVLAFYFGIKAMRRVHYVATPLLRNRTAPNRGYYWGNVFITGAAIILDRIQSFGYSVQSLSAARGDVITRYIVPRLIAERAGRVSDETSGCELCLSYMRHHRFWWMVLPVVMTPRMVWRIIRWLKVRTISGIGK